MKGCIVAVVTCLRKIVSRHVHQSLGICLIPCFYHQLISGGSGDQSKLKYCTHTVTSDLNRLIDITVPIVHSGPVTSLVKNTP